MLEDVNADPPAVVDVHVVYSVQPSAKSARKEALHAHRVRIVMCGAEKLAENQSKSRQETAVERTGSRVQV